MKKIMFYLSSMILIGNIAFGATTASDTANVTLVALNLPTLTVGDIDFGNYILGETKPLDKTSSISITGGTAAKGVNLSVPKALILTKSGSNETVNVTMSLENGVDSGAENVSTLTLDSSGAGSSILNASIDVAPTIAGDYMGTATVTIAYN